MVVFLALLQAVFGVLRTFEIFQIGAELTHRGLILLPLAGIITYARGTVLYCCFAYGILRGKSWAGTVGLLAVRTKRGTLRECSIQWASAGRAVVLAIVPAVLLVYILMDSRRPVPT